MTTKTSATPAQLDAIERASRRAGFDSPQDAVAAADVRSSNWRYDLRRVDASIVLDALTAGLRPIAPPTADEITTDDAGIPAAAAIALVGKTAQITSRKGNTYTAQVRDIKPMDDGEPAFTLRTPDARYLDIRLRNVVGWALVTS